MIAIAAPQTSLPELRQNTTYTALGVVIRRDSNVQANGHGYGVSGKKEGRRISANLLITRGGDSQMWTSEYRSSKTRKKDAVSIVVDDQTVVADTAFWNWVATFNIRDSNDKIVDKDEKIGMYLFVHFVM